MPQRDKSDDIPPRHIRIVRGIPCKARTWFAEQLLAEQKHRWTRRMCCSQVQDIDIKRIVMTGYNLVVIENAVTVDDIKPFADCAKRNYDVEIITVECDVETAAEQSDLTVEELKRMAQDLARAEDAFPAEWNHRRWPPSA